MSLIRSALYTGLLSSLPLIVWTLASLHGIGVSAEAVAILSDTASITLLLQTILLMLFIPLFASRERWFQLMTAALLLISVPWPLLVLTWLGGSSDLLTLCIGQGGVILLALTLVLISKAVARLVVNKGIRDPLLSLVQLGAVSLLLVVWTEWL